MIDSLPACIGGRYRIIRLLGRGGMGLVYEVEHIHTGARLALKVLGSRALTGGHGAGRFRREARISARIRSDHVVTVLDADTAPELGDAPYFVMELLEGADLARTCGEVPQPAERVVDWLRQVARALDKAHALGIIHRDLKPENLFLATREDGTTTIKILDFGIAKLALDAGLTTASEEIVGTPLFMSPEQIDIHQTPVTSRADLFSLGLIAHRLLTGRHYWSTRVLVPLMREICIQAMPSPSTRGSTLGPAFDGWFARACDREVTGRFETAGAQVEALAAALNVGPRSERPAVFTAPATPSAGAPGGLRRTAGIASIAGMVAISTVVVWRGAVTGHPSTARTRPDGSASTAPRFAGAPIASAAEHSDLRTPAPADDAATITPSEPTTASALRPRAAPAATSHAPSAQPSGPSSKPLPGSGSGPASAASAPRPAPTSIPSAKPSTPPDPFADQH